MILLLYFKALRLCQTIQILVVPTTVDERVAYLCSVCFFFRQTSIFQKQFLISDKLQPLVSYGFLNFLNNIDALSSKVENTCGHFALNNWVLNVANLG